MVLDAFQSSRSDQIRELRAAIRQAHDNFDDDKAYELMGELKQLKDAEGRHRRPGRPEQQVPDQPHPLQLQGRPGLSGDRLRLALKVLNQTHQAISNPSSGKSKAARAKKDAEVFTISKDGMSVTLPLRTRVRA
jgi:hypothetical protein